MHKWAIYFLFAFLISYWPFRVRLIKISNIFIPDSLFFILKCIFIYLSFCLRSARVPKNDNVADKKRITTQVSPHSSTKAWTSGRTHHPAGLVCILLLCIFWTYAFLVSHGRQCACAYRRHHYSFKRFWNSWVYLTAEMAEPYDTVYSWSWPRRSQDSNLHQEDFINKSKLNFVLYGYRAERGRDKVRQQAYSINLTALSYYGVLYAQEKYGDCGGSRSFLLHYENITDRLCHADHRRRNMHQTSINYWIWAHKKWKASWKVIEIQNWWLHWERSKYQDRRQEWEPFIIASTAIAVGHKFIPSKSREYAFTGSPRTFHLQYVDKIWEF